MNIATMKVWEDDLPEEIMERLAGVLCELGVMVECVDESMDGEYVIKEYTFDLAEPLPEPAFLTT